MYVCKDTPSQILEEYRKLYNLAVEDVCQEIWDSIKVFGTPIYTHKNLQFLIALHERNRNDER